MASSMAASCAPLILYGRKMKLLEVMRILERETDAELALTANRIADRLEEKGFPHVDRKGVYDDINVLNGFLKPGGGGGCKRPRIEKDEITFGYYLDNRYFSVADLRLIIDALLSSSFFRRSHPDIPTNTRSRVRMISSIPCCFSWNLFSMPLSPDSFFCVACSFLFLFYTPIL